MRKRIKPKISWLKKSKREIKYEKILILYRLIILRMIQLSKRYNILSSNKIWYRLR